METDFQVIYLKFFLIFFNFAQAKQNKRDFVKSLAYCMICVYLSFENFFFYKLMFQYYSHKAHFNMVYLWLTSGNIFSYTQSKLQKYIFSHNNTLARINNIQYLNLFLNFVPLPSISLSFFFSF